MKPRITVITLGVDDLERSLEFYRNGLGLPTQGIVGKEFEHGAVAFFDLQAGLRLAIWNRKDIAHDAKVLQTSPSPTGFWLLFIMRCIWGIAWTFLRLGAYFVILDVSSQDNRGYYMGVYNGLYRLGSLVGMLLGGFLADFYGVTMVSVFFAILSFLAVVLVILYVNQSSKSIHVNTVHHVTTPLWRNKSVFWTLVTGLFIAMLYQGLFTSTLSYLIDSRHNTTLIWGVSMGAASLAGILQALRWAWEPWLAPWFGKRSDGFKGRRSIFVSTLVIASFLFALIPFNISFGIWLLILLGIQLTATVLTTVMDALASDIATQLSKKNVIMTLHSIATDLGAALGPLLLYFADSRFGVEGLYWGAAFILLLLSLRWWEPWRKNRQICGLIRK